MITLGAMNRAEAVRYMGGGGKKADAALTALIDECERELIKTARPKYLYKIIDLPCDGITSGNDLQRHLSGCEKAAVMCATLGAEADRLIRIAQVADMARAVVLDALASVAIEQVCSQLDELIKAEYPEWFQTYRFSPGYGDYPIEMQRVFLTMLDAPRKIGLTLNESFLMIPSKSVTAIAGLSKNPIEQRRRGCAVCSLRESCKYRRKGERCGF